MKYLNKSLMLSFLDSRTTPDRPTGENRPTGGTLIVTTDPSPLGVGREVRSPENLVTSARVRAIVGGLQIGGGNLIDHLRLDQDSRHHDQPNQCHHSLLPDPLSLLQGPYRLLLKSLLRTYSSLLAATIVLIR